MELKAFLSKLQETPEAIAFDDTLQTIERNYTFTPTVFNNGDLRNETGQNSGSCKLFSFAQLQQLTKEQTLQCFGTYYSEDVLKNPDGESHQNIRNFMKYGWEGIEFEGIVLEKV